MRANPFLGPILDNDVLTRGLGDPEARVLVEWLVEHTEGLAENGQSEAQGWVGVKQLFLRARAISRFVVLWCHRQDASAACQLAGAERFGWPLPDGPIDPCELMAGILEWEDQQSRQGVAA